MLEEWIRLICHRFLLVLTAPRWHEAKLLSLEVLSTCLRVYNGTHHQATSLLSNPIAGIHHQSALHYFFFSPFFLFSIPLRFRNFHIKYWGCQVWQELGSTSAAFPGRFFFFPFRFNIILQKQDLICFKCLLLIAILMENYGIFFFMALSIRIKLQICLLQLCGLLFFFSLSPHFADSGFSLVNIWDFHWLTLLPSSKRYQDFFFSAFTYHSPRSCSL